MKAIVCAKGDLHITSFGREWTSCTCGNARAKWIDAEKGTCVVAAKDRNAVKLLGLNNNYLFGVFTLEKLVWSEYRELHAKATDAAGHIFDHEKAACWAVIIDIGRISDCRWATDEEFQEAFKNEAAWVGNRLP